MKIKKIVLLPLLALTLAGCDFLSQSSAGSDITSGSGSVLDDSYASDSSLQDESSAMSSDVSSAMSGDESSDESSSIDESSETPVKPSTEAREANLLVLTSLVDFLETDLREVSSFELGAEFMFLANYVEYNFNEHGVLGKEIEIDGGGVFEGALKVSDLNTLGVKPKASAEALFEVELTAGSEYLLAADGELNLYLKDDWVYAHTDVTYSGLLTEDIEEEIGIPLGEEKLKWHAPNALDGLFDDFEPLDLAEVLAGQEDILDVMEMLGEPTVKTVGTDKTIAYDLNFDLAMNVALMYFAEMDEELTEEEFDLLIERIEEIGEQLFDIEKAAIQFTINRDGRLVGLMLDFDFSLIIPDGDILSMESFDYHDFARVELDLAAILDLSFMLGGVVDVVYPTDLGTYTELEP